ncbi:hypothetical protein ACWD3J_13910 [Streptomyces sp. NPDC002755]
MSPSFVLAAPTETELAAWLTENVGDHIHDDYATTQQLLAAFDFASRTSTSLNNPHHITQAIDDARDLDRMALTWPPIPSTVAAAQLLERFRITRKPANHAALFVDLPMPVVVSRHQCPYCRRFTRADLAQVRDHMTRCWQNPVLRCCKTCIHHQDGSHPEEDESCTSPDGPEWEEYRFPVLHCPIWEASA